MAESPVGNITYLVEDQDGAEILVNAAINRLETIAGLMLKSRNDNTPPGTPSNGDAYLIGSSPTGDWAGHADEFTVYYDGWLFWNVRGGMYCHVEDEKIDIAYSESESAWYYKSSLYTTTERRWTGDYFLGKKLFRRTFSFGALPNTTQKTSAHSITSLDKLVYIRATADNGTNQIDFSSGWDNEGSGGSNHIDLIINDTNMVVDTDFDASTYTAYITLFYTVN